MHVLLTVADAVVAALNAGSFSQPFTAQRSYRPTYEPADLSDLRVTVVPKSVEVTNASRSESHYDCTVDIGIQQKTDPGQLPLLDELMQLVGEVADHLQQQRLAALPSAAWVSLANEPAFAPEHLHEQRIFTSVLTVTYRVRK